MTDEQLLQEILRSPLDDMPERSFEQWQILSGMLVVLLVAGVLGFMVFGGNDPVTDQSGAVTTVPGSSGSTVPGATAGNDGETTDLSSGAVAPEEGGAFHEWVAIGDGEMLMFGGLIPLAGGGSAPFDGTWRFDTVTGQWSVEAPAIAPSPRSGHAMAYHPPTERVIVFGGGAATTRPCPRIRFCPGPEDNQLWQYDPTTGIWEDMTPADTASVTWPIPRFGMRFVYEPVTERLITFGGVGVFGENFTPNFWNDTWAYDPATNTWEDLSDPDEANRPHGAVQYGMVWSDEAQRVLMFAGDGIPNDPETLYAFDPATNTWEDLGENAPGEGPKDRWFHGMDVDPRTDRVVVFGGNGSIYRVIGGGTIRSNGNLDEVWTWTPAEGWTLMNPLPLDIVASASDGDPETLGIVVYGGDDVWSYDGALDEWKIVWDRPDEDEDA